jgi:hypothetical protein
MTTLRNITKAGFQRQDSCLYLPGKERYAVRGGESQMSLLHPIWKPCPHCGRPMKLVRDEAARGAERYVCPDCDVDPLHDPAARK